MKNWSIVRSHPFHVAKTMQLQIKKRIVAYQDDNPCGEKLQGRFWNRVLTLRARL
jgi:hypothetical protein